MNQDNQHTSIISINNDGSNSSYFTERNIRLQGSPARFLSEQIPAENFRFRTSDHRYSSEWHVAGDPTLLVILTGSLQIELRTGESRTFSAGELFIANDYLKQGIQFDNTIHGHRAKVLGNENFSALHIKLEKRTDSLNHNTLSRASSVKAK